MARSKREEIFVIRLTVFISLLVIVGVLLTVSYFLNVNGEKQADNYNTSVQQQTTQGDTTSQEDTSSQAEEQSTQSEVKVESVSKELMDAVKFDGNKPSFAFPKGYKASSNIGVTVIKKGDGATLSPTSSIQVNYALWNEDGPVAGNNTFESGDPIGFSLSRVIPAWTKGLTGQKVGSVVAIYAPSSQAYNDGKNLFFVVQILKAA